MLSIFSRPNLNITAEPQLLISFLKTYSFISCFMNFAVEGVCFFQSTVGNVIYISMHIHREMDCNTKAISW